MIQPFGLTPEDCAYAPYPLSHIGSAYYDVLPMMLLGGRVVLRDRFSASNFWPEVQKYVTMDREHRHSLPVST